MWDDRVKPQRRGYLKRSTKPIKRSYIKRKPKRDRTFKDGRIRLASKSSLRRQTHDAAGGKCQHEINGKICGKDAPWGGAWWKRGHLAHKKHGAGFRDDRFGESYWSCGDCHRAHHAGEKRKKTTTRNIVWDAELELWTCLGCDQRWLRNSISRCQCEIAPVREIGDYDLIAIDEHSVTRLTTLHEKLGDE